MPMVVEELLKDIQHACHLSEDEDSVPSTLQLSKQKVECLQFTYTHKNIRRSEKGCLIHSDVSLDNIIALINFDSYK